jgi:hypothetical protein
MKMSLPDCSTFTNEMQQAVKSGVVLGARDIDLILLLQISKKLATIAPIQRWFLFCELYDLLKQLWNYNRVTSSLLKRLWDQVASGHCQHKLRDTCQFSAMGNLLVHFGYAAHHVSGRANVYRRIA